MGLFASHTVAGKVEDYFTKWINPFYWLRKGVDKATGTNTSNLGLGEVINVDKERDNGISGIDLGDISADDLFDLAGDASASQNTANLAGSLPVIGGALKQVLSGEADATDKQLALLQSLYEMQNNNNQAAINREFQDEQAFINRQFQNNERLAVQAYNTEMWNMTNEYNSLGAQLDRARSAGVSPNAIIGNGSNSGFASPMSSSPQSGSMPSGSQASYSSGLSSQLLTHSAMVENLMAQTKKTNSETNLNKQEYDWNEMTLPQRLELFDIAVKKGNLENHHLFKDLNIKDVSLEIQKGTYAMLCRMNEEELKLKQAQTIDLYNSQYERLQRIRMFEEQIKNESKKGDLIDAEIKNTETDTLLGMQTASGKEIENEMLALSKELKTIEVDFCKSMGVPVGTPESMFMFYLWKNGRLWDWNAYIKANSYKTTMTPESLQQHFQQYFEEMRRGGKEAPPYTGTWRGPKGIYNPKQLPKWTPTAPKSLPLPGFGKTFYL